MKFQTGPTRVLFVQKVDDFETEVNGEDSLIQEIHIVFIGKT